MLLKLHQILPRLLLIASLLLAGLAQATAGMAMAGAQERADDLVELVICGSDGPRTILVPQGSVPGAPLPAQDCRDCPACVLATLFAALPAPLPEFPASAAGSLPRLPHAHPAPGQTASRPKARAPPTKA